jgi:hypothetical protein
MTLEQTKDLSTVIGAVVAAFTLAKALFEYIRQNAAKRAEFFITMRARLKENETFRNLLDQIEHDDPNLGGIDFKEKRDLLGFFEEIALMLNSGIVRADVAHYMFGYYAIRCWESEHFWQGVNRESQYWSAFADFVVRMKSIEQEFVYSRKRLRL